jgi:hypothetical protein
MVLLLRFLIYKKNCTFVLLFSVFYDMINMKYIKVLPLLILFLSCKKTDNFPEYPVVLEFNITAAAPELAALNSYKEFTKPANINQRLGLGGILIFHTVEDKFYAFDMACPYEVKADTKVHCNNLGVVVCDSCHSQFYVGDGTGFVQKGQSKNSLKKYTVYYDASRGNILVTN